MLRIRRINPLDLLVRQVAIASIKIYQRYISPHKGFSCPHRVLYGGESCSGYIKGGIAQKGLLEAMSIARERFQACKRASFILRSQQSESEKKNRHRLENDCLNSLGSCQCGDSSCASCIPLPDCSIPDCSLPDCAVLDCGSLDCIGCCGSGVFTPLSPRLLSYKRYNKRSEL